MPVVRPPWSEELVKRLNTEQLREDRHPYTCGKERGSMAHKVYAWKNDQMDLGILVATREGWVCPVCDYKQDWVRIEE